MIMAETFTYEDLYELLRKEKFDNDLQEITAADLKKIKEYFDTKKSFLEKQSKSGTFFNSKKLEKVQTEIENAKKTCTTVRQDIAGAEPGILPHKQSEYSNSCDCCEVPVGGNVE